MKKTSFLLLLSSTLCSSLQAMENNFKIAISRYDPNTYTSLGESAGIKKPKKMTKKKQQQQRSLFFKHKNENVYVECPLKDVCGYKINTKTSSKVTVSHARNHLTSHIKTDVCSLCKKKLTSIAISHHFKTKHPGKAYKTIKDEKSHSIYKKAYEHMFTTSGKAFKLTEEDLEKLKSKEPSAAAEEIIEKHLNAIKE